MFGGLGCSATSKNDTSLETEQTYGYNESDRGVGLAHDMGTGIEPATYESFPDEVRDQL